MLSDIFLDESCRMFAGASLYAVQVFPCLPSILITWIERHRAAGYLVQINAQKGFVFTPYNFSRGQHGT